MSSPQSARRHGLFGCTWIYSLHELGKLTTPSEYQVSAHYYSQVVVTLLSITFAVGKKMN